MKDLFDQLEDGAPKGDKIAKLVADMKSVSQEMGMDIEDLVEKVKSECCGEEMGEEKEMPEMMSEDEGEEMPKSDNGAKKAIVIAMMKRKAGKM
tara:strand:+ start:426 stop:707 length:282 start_codon:yes stop_codon:yes gene_type:complete